MGRGTAVSLDSGLSVLMHNFCQRAIITHILCSCIFCMHFEDVCVCVCVCFKLVNLCVASNGQLATVRLYKLANDLATACQAVCVGVCLCMCACACVRMHVAKKEKSCP